MNNQRSLLIAGASSDIGFELIKRLAAFTEWKIGLHCFKGRKRLEIFLDTLKIPDKNISIFECDLSTQKKSHQLVDTFVEWAGDINGLIQLTGDVASNSNWLDLKENYWNADIAVNLSAPFFLAQQAFAYMQQGNKGGHIIFTSTASAKHGGGQMTLAYTTAKAGIECLTKGLARSGAPYGILVNAIAPGFIETRFHKERLGKNAVMLLERAKMVPLKRAGQPKDIARMVEYLLLEGGNFITGEVINISGGDWL
jgi:3-oxoacyl-[acyl-carrier protein] reductase